MKLRTLVILCCVLFSTASSFGQSAPEKAPDMSTEVRNAFNEVRSVRIRTRSFLGAQASRLPSLEIGRYRELQARRLRSQKRAFAN
jgi:hypothetical protein